MAERSEPGPGEAVAKSLGPAIDPSKNVLDLVNAAVLRLDDLRVADRKLDASLLSGLRELMESKLEAIAHEFELVEGRRQEQKVDTKTAVDAALSAAKDAVKEQAAASEKAILKSENSAGEQSKQNAITFTEQMKNVTSSLQDIKERVQRVENMKQGGQEVRADSRSNVGTVVGIAGAIFGFLMLLIAAISIIVSMTNGVAS